jgi:hypothetical protein
MDAATAAAMSDPQRNPAFRRRWQEQPDHRAAAQAPLPIPEVALEVTGRALLELWRQERRRHEGGRR